MTPTTLPQGPNLRWSLDFVTDMLVDGRRFRVLMVVDDFTHECVALVTDTSLSARAWRGLLYAIQLARGGQLKIVSDSGTELTSRAVLHWQEDNRVKRH